MSDKLEQNKHLSYQNTFFEKFDHAPNIVDNLITLNNNAADLIVESYSLDQTNFEKKKKLDCSQSILEKILLQDMSFAQAL